jgi:conjugal transfer/entry exclusion protein
MGACGSDEKERKEIKLNDTEKAILECKTCRDKISRYIKRLSNKQTKSREKAKELVRSKQKDRAIVYLRMAKLHGEQIKISEGQLEKVQNQITQIEATQNLQECMNCLKQGNEILKNLQNSIKIEEWEKVKDDMDELKEKDKEISDYFKQHGINEAQCDEEVNDELDKLLNEIQGGNKINLPSVPKEEITEDKDQIKTINVKKKVIAD